MNRTSGLHDDDQVPEAQMARWWRAAARPGAQRMLDFTLEEAVVTENATALRGDFPEYSPDNPWVC